MSAVTMKHENRDSAIEMLSRHKSEIASAMNHYLAIIIRAIDECGGLIHEGNFNLFTRTKIETGERVVYFYGSWLPYSPDNEKHFNEAVELYSEDGWETVEDIANWADIAKQHRDKVIANRNRDKVGMSADEILDAVASFACSQGFYGRLLDELRTNPDKLQELVDRKFANTLAMVIYLEEA